MQDAGMQRVLPGAAWGATEESMLQDLQAAFPRAYDDLAGPAMNLTPHDVYDQADGGDDDAVFDLDGMTPCERDLVFDVDFQGDDGEAVMDIISSFEAVLCGPAQAGGGAAADDDEPQTVIAVPVQTTAAPRKRRAPDSAPVAVYAAAVPVGGDSAPVRKRMAASSDGPRGSRGGSGPQRTVPWRRVGSVENERMQAAVWVYRFAPAVKSKTIQREFGVAVKSLMRYVYDSCLPEYAAYRLYFGAAGETVAGMADRAVPKEAGRVTAASIGYVPDGNAAGVPELARALLARLER